MRERGGDDKVQFGFEAVNIVVVVVVGGGGAPLNIEGVGAVDLPSRDLFLSWTLSVLAEEGGNLAPATLMFFSVSLVFCAVK